MRGLMITSKDWKRQPSDLDGFAEPPGVDETVRALSPRDVSFFARFFGPLFPEFLQRTWILYPPEFLHFPLAWYLDEDPEVTDLELEISWLEAMFDHVHTRTDNGCLVAGGAFLVAAANHLQEFDDLFYGLPVPALEPAQLEDLSSWEPEGGPLPPSLAKQVDIGLGSYEGIWTIYSTHERLLERVRRHVPPLAGVTEAEGRLDALFLS